MGLCTVINVGFDLTLGGHLIVAFNAVLVPSF